MRLLCPMRLINLCNAFVEDVTCHGYCIHQVWRKAMVNALVVYVKKALLGVLVQYIMSHDQCSC